MQESISKCISSGQSGKVILYAVIILMISLLTMCNKEEYATKDYPRLNTLKVTSISESGVIFNAEVLSGNLTEIIEYGFVWNTNIYPETELNAQFVIADNSGKIFTCNIRSVIKKGVIYYMRSYVKTDKFLVYGKIVNFKSL